MRQEFTHHPSESTDFTGLVTIIGLATVSICLWFYAAGTVKVFQFSPDAYFYLDQLPAGYWAGLVATLALFGCRGVVRGRGRTLLELTTLFLLALYLYGLTSFVYQNPRFLDTYQHEGNSLSILFSGGWYNSPVWYVYQFPGGFTFFAQLTAVAGIDPFQVMKYYPAGLSLIVALLLYALVKSYSPNYAALSSAFILTGFWFQLHVSPQSLELIPYMGVLFVLLKIMEDEPRRRLWTMIAIAVTPILVLSHPETPLVLVLGIAGFFVVQSIFSAGHGEAVRSGLKVIGPFFGALAIVTFAWWTIVASGALQVVESIVNGALEAGVIGLSHGAPNVPANPSPSYHVTILLQEGIAAAAWAIGLFMLLFVKGFRTREYLLTGLYLAAISTIPIALFANADVLQRAYLFALFPAGLLAASILDRKTILRLKGRSIAPLLSKGLLLMIIISTIAMPVSRYGLDSFDYLPQSSLTASDVAAGLYAHSVLLLHPGWYGWRYYAPFHGYEGAVLLEQKNLSSLHGGFVKAGTYTEANVSYTASDNSSNYLLVSDFYESSYNLRFASNATSYLALKDAFENQASLQFNLVYSTGTDRLYENRNLG